MARSEKPAFAANIDAAVAPYLSILRDEGRERECLVLGVGSDKKARRGREAGRSCSTPTARHAPIRGPFIRRAISPGSSLSPSLDPSVLKGHPGCLCERERQATQLEFESCSSDSAMNWRSIALNPP